MTSGEGVGRLQGGKVDATMQRCAVLAVPGMAAVAIDDTHVDDEVMS